MTKSRTVLMDLKVFRKELTEHCSNFEKVSQRNLWRPMMDIVFDWIIIIFTIYMGYLLGILAYPIVIFIVANRQRALGNLLHDAGHQNLYRNKMINDLIANLFLAPAVMVDINKYRDLHFKHHAKLGKTKEDPDYIFTPLQGQANWYSTYCRELFSRTNWMASIFGYLIKKEVDWQQRVYIGLWWIAIFWLLVASINSLFALYVITIWLIAKGTVFHMITTFREMCDHFGLESGGIYSYTRDIISSRLVCWMVHPHNNAYHLSHHLMPSIPYYQLPTIQKIFCKLPSYDLQAIVCRSYFHGSDAVIRHKPTLQRIV